MTTDDIYGLNAEQHRELGKLAKNARTAHQRGVAQAKRREDRYRGMARVLMLGSELPTYDSRTPRDVALFRYVPDGQQLVIQMDGYDLAGDLVLTIDSIEMHVPCESTTDELRLILTENGITSDDCRVTVFPALWEFDFNLGQWQSQRPTVTCSPYEPPPEDTVTPVFSGDLTLIDEGWISATDDGETVLTIQVVDWVPWPRGAVHHGAIGIAGWCFGVGWIVTAWQCRGFSFAAGYQGGAG